RVTILRPLRIGDYGIGFTPHGLMVGHVFAMHWGKYGKHESRTDSSNISALSKISVQLFEHFYDSEFRSIPTPTAILQTKQFAHIPPSDFLCLLSGEANLLPTGLELRSDDSQLYNSLSRGYSKFVDAMKEFRKRGGKSAEAAALDDD
ncbi:hypothetical protein R3P38DRAFT_2550092, partial [Favolaschia claudopus]